MNTEFDRHGAMARAIAFAAYAHDGQNRKGGALPYIVHPMEAVAIAATLTNDPDVLMAAALHDVLEDCGVSEAELRVRFGRRVAQLVRAVSEEKEDDAQGSWQKRKLHTINRLRSASREELILTLADKLSNLRSMDRDLRVHGAALWQRFNQTNPSMHRWYYASIAETLSPLAGTEAHDELLRRLKSVFGE